MATVSSPCVFVCSLSGVQSEALAFVVADPPDVDPHPATPVSAAAAAITARHLGSGGSSWGARDGTLES